jgi:hypothetical protein
MLSVIVLSSFLACISADEVEKWVYAFQHAKEEII